jgi:drug/metabolite transporter (DMT)-like permease
MPYFLAITLAALLGGSVPALAKFALAVLPTFFLLFIRFFIACLTLLPFIIRSKELNLKTLKNLTAVGIVGALNPTILYIALKYTQASVSPLIYAATPLLTALYASRKKVETISKVTFKGMIIGLGGVALIIILPLLTNNGNQQLSFKGNLLIFTAVLAFTAYGILSKKQSEKLGVSPIALTFYFSLFGLLLSFPFAFNELNSGMIIWSKIGVMHWLSAIAVGVTGTTLFYLVYQNAVKSGGATAASLFTYLQPIVGILLPVIILGETITIPFIIGAVLAIYGVQLATRKKSV